MASGQCLAVVSSGGWDPARGLPLASRIQKTKHGNKRTQACGLLTDVLSRVLS